jgi:hypothetical protein
LNTLEEMLCQRIEEADRVRRNPVNDRIKKRNRIFGGKTNNSAINVGKVARNPENRIILLAGNISVNQRTQIGLWAGKPQADFYCSEAAQLEVHKEKSLWKVLRADVLPGSFRGNSAGGLFRQSSFSS